MRRGSLAALLLTASTCSALKQETGKNSSDVQSVTLTTVLSVSLNGTLTMTARNTNESMERENSVRNFNLTFSY